MPWNEHDIAYLFDPRDAELERREKRRAARTTPLSCGNVPGSNVATQPKRGPAGRYTVASYRRAIARGCGKAFPLPAHLARGRVEGAKGSRRETPADWRRRLGTEWKAAEKWTADHEWAPNQLRHTAATRFRREFGIEVARSLLGHRLGSGVTDVYAGVDAAKVAGIVERVG